MSESNIVVLPGCQAPQTGEPNRGLIQALETALEHARSGRLQSLIGAGFLSSGDRLTIFGGHHDNVHEMLGSITWLEHEYVARITDSIAKPPKGGAA